jgi:hypothetical protein
MIKNVMYMIGVTRPEKMIHNLQEKSCLLCLLKTLKLAGGTGKQKEHFSHICTHRFLFQDIVLLLGYYCTFAPESNRAVTLEQHIIREPARVPNWQCISLATLRASDEVPSSPRCENPTV